MRVLAIDPGEKQIGLALSDPSGSIARPLTSLSHAARAKDAAHIVALAVEHGAEIIVIGLALDAAQTVGPQARRAERLAEAIRQLTSLPVILHDESYSTSAAEQALRATQRSPSARGKKRGARRTQRARLHAVAAAAILQSYLDAHARHDKTA